MWLYYLILATIFFATLAMCIDKGMWSNTLSTINILLSGLIAFGFYEPLAKLAVDNGLDKYTYLTDFLSIWVLYVVSFILLHRVFSQVLSKTRMRFKNPIDTIGGPFGAAVAAWLMTCFVAATLHAAPFDRDCFGGVLADKSRSSTLTNPDLAWLSIAQNMLSNSNMGGSDSFSVDRYVTEFTKQRAALEKQEGLKNP